MSRQEPPTKPNLYIEVDMRTNIIVKVWRAYSLDLKEIRGNWLITEPESLWLYQALTGKKLGMLPFAATERAARQARAYILAQGNIELIKLLDSYGPVIRPTLGIPNAEIDQPLELERTVSLINFPPPNHYKESNNVLHTICRIGPTGRTYFN